MIDASQIPENVWKAAMSRYHKVIRHNPAIAWQSAIAWALENWPNVMLSTHVEEGRRIILPLPTEARDE